MVFSSLTFLFAFLPTVFLVWVAAPRRIRPLVLLSASFLFYAWGGPRHLWVMLLSIGFNYLCGLLISLTKHRARRTFLVSAGIIGNLALLGYYKYLNFFLELLQPLNLQIVHEQIVLPLGISFFTFQGMSYLIDVYREEVPGERNILILSLYIALFPQLIAGPIVRYTDVRIDMHRSSTTIDLVSAGIVRFLIGLGKKVLIANPLGEMVDLIYGAPLSEVSSSALWLAVWGYFFQIYFDFSAYSDMAIGLGRMFGFHFPENFRFPYAARSLRDFWRRWHISLSTWFRDYLYIPLGGNKGSEWKVLRNLTLVFLLCGIWHGASLNFALWGLCHGAVLILERGRFGRALERVHPLLANVYVWFIVALTWVLFRASDLSHAMAIYSSLFAFKLHAPITVPTVVTGERATVLVLAFIFSYPFWPMSLSYGSSLMSKLHLRTPLFSLLGNLGKQLVVAWFSFLVLILSVMRLAAQTYNPFIYFRF